MLYVCCFLWFDPLSPRRDVYTYDETHVRRLKAQIEPNLSIPHEFICVSDRPIAGIKTIPIDWQTHVPGTRFSKLQMFRTSGPLAGKRLLYLDLDCVVTGSLDPLVDRDEDLVLWRNPNYGAPLRALYNTSMILHNAGTRPLFWHLVANNLDEWKRKTPEETWAYIQQKTGYGGTDQALISYYANPAGEAHWTDADGVYGAGRLGDVVAGAGAVLPDNARIVFTPGRRTPWTEEFRSKHPWAERFEIAA